MFDDAISVCAARWVRTNYLCARAGSNQLADVRLCDHHYRRILDEAAIVLGRELQAQRPPWEWEPDAARVIYYLRRASDGLIKIGTSARLTVRLRELHAEHGPLQLLLTHRGDYETEQAIHRQFATLRVNHTEFFRPYKRLMTWIIEIRGQQDAHTVLPGTMPMADLTALAKRRRRTVISRSLSVDGATKTVRSDISG